MRQPYVYFKLQMKKVSRNRECDELERLIPSCTREDDDIVDNEDEIYNDDENTGSTSDCREIQDIPIDSSPLIDRRRKPSR